MGDKRTHFGRAGEYFAMSELLLRGWNVAVPVVDIGDDAFVIDDRDKATRRIQVKTSATVASELGRLRSTFKLSRNQLRTAQPIELFYIFMMRLAVRWRFLVIPREDLFEIRNVHVEGASSRASRGRLPRADGDARSDALRLDVVLDRDVATGWGTDLSRYLDSWPEELGTVEGGPGSLENAGSSDLREASAEDLAPSRDREK